MALVDPTLVRRHLRVDGTDEDDTIAAYQAAAEFIVTEYLDRVVQAAEPLPPDDSTAMLIEPPIVAAVLIVTADLFDNRNSEEGGSEAVLSPTVRRLLAPYRVWRQYEEDDPLA